MWCSWALQIEKLCWPFFSQNLALARKFPKNLLYKAPKQEQTLYLANPAWRWYKWMKRERQNLTKKANDHWFGPNVSTTRRFFFLISKTSKQSSTWWNGIFAEFCRPVVLSLLDQASRRRSYVSMYPAQVIGFEEERLRFRTERRRNAIDVRNSGA